MRAGVDCSMCADAHLPSNPFSVLVAELSASYARLSRNQAKPGYCVVVAKQHVPEVHEFDDETLIEFWRDVASVGRAVERVYSPVKLFNLVMGGRCPHVHCHVHPQYSDDDPFALDFGEAELLVGADELRSAADQLAAHLISRAGGDAGGSRRT